MAPEVKTTKNSKLPKLSENYIELVGKGGCPPICTWINDTQTHYFMEQYPLLLQDQAKVMDVVVATEKVEVLKKRKDGPSKAILKSI
jgi:hypothetical protein